MKRLESRETNWIPSNYGRKPLSIAARVKSRRNVVKASQCKAVAVQPGVEPSKWTLALPNQIIIQQRDDPSHGLYVGCQPNEAERRRKERCTGDEQLVPENGMASPLTTIPKSIACAETSGTPRPAGLHKLHIKNISATVRPWQRTYL